MSNVPKPKPRPSDSERLTDSDSYRALMKSKAKDVAGKARSKKSRPYGDLKGRRRSKNIEDARISTALAGKGISTKDLVDKTPKSKAKSEQTDDMNSIVNSYREVIPVEFGDAVNKAFDGMKSKNPKPGKFKKTKYNAQVTPGKFDYGK